jgi:hypothetical protein
VKIRGISVILIMVLVTVFILEACAKHVVAPTSESAPIPVPSPTPTGHETVIFLMKTWRQL